MKNDWLYTLGELLSVEEKTVNFITYDEKDLGVLYVHLTDGRVLAVSVKAA